LRQQLVDVLNLAARAVGRGDKESCLAVRRGRAVVASDDVQAEVDAGGDANAGTARTPTIPNVPTIVASAF